ncbi:MAG: hypothetical protein N3A67_07090, partial [Ignavibacteria bacterium]|nr:hypothetical protein [Ignavibacteria bacterium]
NLLRGNKIPFKVGQAIEILISDVSVEEESMILEPNPEYFNTAISVEHKPKPKERRPAKEVQTEKSEGGFSIADLLPESITESLLDNNK